jgi:isopentenyl diphosphate isomerase/L-lactate dehydrogenase-like FMN-dependent dehydrogenase
MKRAPETTGEVHAMTQNALKPTGPAPTLPPRRRFESIPEATEMARRALPKPMFDRIIDGSERGITARDNLAAFEDVTFQPHVAAAAPIRSQATTVLGTAIATPILLGPVGALRLLHPEGVLAATAAAAAAGTILACSPAAGHSLDELADIKTGPTWWQLSISGGRDRAEKTIDAAKRRGYQALVITVDSPVKPKGQAVRLDVRSALQFGPDLVRRPRWTTSFIRDGMRLNVANAVLGGDGSPAPSIQWSDLAWIADQWRGPIVVKGVTNGDDARRAVDAGAGAVVVSNHGGIALDGAPATLRALPDVVAAVGDRAEVLLDGGIRWGSDAVKAIALGARAVLIGRAYMMGLAVGGEAGVRRVLEILSLDIDRTLAFLGCPDVQSLNASYLDDRRLRRS